MSAVPGNRVDTSAHRAGYIAIVGRPNVGKSTLLNCLVGQKISVTSRKPQTTRFSIQGIRSDADAQYVFVDTPGLEWRQPDALSRSMHKVVAQALAMVDVVLLVVEACRFDARDRVLLDMLPRNRPVVVAANKIDLIADKTSLLPFIKILAESFEFAAIVPVSGGRAVQIPELLKAMCPLLPSSPSLFGEEEVTQRGERFFAGEFIREKILRYLGMEVPYAAAVMIEHFSESRGLRRIDAAIVVERPGQKAILIGKNGDKLKLIATRARADMERMYGGKVYLQVWVKVKKDWRGDARAVKQLGYCAQ
ncbi:MAG: GTPase Era [Burkholderiales bacterium]